MTTTPRETPYEPRHRAVPPQDGAGVPDEAARTRHAPAEADPAAVRPAPGGVVAPAGPDGRTTVTEPLGSAPAGSAPAGSAPAVEQDRGPGSWVGRTVHAPDGTKLGRLTAVHPPADGSTVPWGVVRGRMGRGRLVPLDRATERDDEGIAVPVDRAALRTAPSAGTGDPDPHTRSELDRHYAGRGALAVARERQHERFGGFKIGAAFFGWIVAVGLTVILFAIAAGIAAAAGFSFDLSGSPADPAPATVGLVGAIAIVVVMALAYLGGGYVAGRLTRFDGARNGTGAWVIGLIVTIVLGVVGAIAGAEYNVMDRVILPSIALTTGALTIGGIILLVVVAIVTLLAAALGGRMGERYHRRVDKAGAMT